MSGNSGALCCSASSGRPGGEVGAPDRQPPVAQRGAHEQPVRLEHERAVVLERVLRLRARWLGRERRGEQRHVGRRHHLAPERRRGEQHDGQREEGQGRRGAAAGVRQVHGRAAYPRACDRGAMASRLLCHALGGGLGPVTRTRAVLEATGFDGAVALLAAPGAAAVAGGLELRSPGSDDAADPPALARWIARRSRTGRRTRCSSTRSPAASRRAVRPRRARRAGASPHRAAAALGAATRGGSRAAAALRRGPRRRAAAPGPRARARRPRRVGRAARPPRPAARGRHRRPARARPGSSSTPARRARSARSPGSPTSAAATRPCTS